MKFFDAVGTANTEEAISTLPASTVPGRVATADTLADIPETMPVQMVEGKQFKLQKKIEFFCTRGITRGV